MEAFVVSSAHWVALAAQSLVSIAWESMLLVGCVALCLRMLPGVSAAARSVVWVAVLVVLVGLPFLHEGGAGPVAVGAGRVEVGMQWAWIVTGAWVALALVRLGQLVRSAWHVRKVSAGAVELSQVELAGLELDCVEMPRFRRVRICTSEQVGVPCVAGFLSPRVLLPPAVLDGLSNEDLRQIVQHELEHLRRRDDWVNLLQKCSLVLLPLNPGLWWVERRLCMERELACDDRVLERTGAPKAYAVCLANLAEKSMARRGVSLVLGAWRRHSELTKRICRILRTPTRQWGGAATAGVVSVLLAGVSVGALALGRTAEIVSFGGGDVISQPVHLASQSVTVPGPMQQAESIVPARAVLVSTTAVVKRRAKIVEHVTARSEDAVQPLVLASSEPESAARGPETLVDWKKTAKREHVKPAVITGDSHFTYAAIPFADGWLIVQL